jgi:hypothetical protein
VASQEGISSIKLVDQSRYEQKLMLSLHVKFPLLFLILTMTGMCQQIFLNSIIKFNVNLFMSSPVSCQAEQVLYKAVNAPKTCQ